EDVPRMADSFIEARRGMAVEDRAAEGDVLGAVSVAAQGEVPARHHELELTAAGFPENGDRLLFPERLPVRVVLELLEDQVVPLRVVHAEEYLADELFLIGGEEITGDV